MINAAEANVPLSKLTVICLSYERQTYIRRQIAYFSNSPITLIVADGSAARLSDLNPRNVTSSGFRLIYIHLPGAATFSFYKRLGLALEEVETPFVTLIDDADILFQSGLARAVLELETNAEISIAAGRVGCFSKNLISRRINFTDWGHWSQPLRLDLTPSKNLIKMMSEKRNANLYYVVCREELFKRACSKFIQADFKIGVDWELFLTAFLVINSKFILGNFPFWMRGDAPSIRGLVPQEVSHHEWYSSNPDDRKLFIACLAEELSSREKCSYEQAVLSVNQYLQIHYEQHIVAEGRWGILIAIKRYISLRLRSLRAFLACFRFGLIIIQGYRYLRVGRSSVDIIDYFEANEIVLTDEEINDLRRYSDLLNRFPRGLDIFNRFY